MKNKENLKKFLVITIAIFIIYLILLVILNIRQTHIYNANVNITLNNIITNIKENYPEVDVNKIVEILNKESLNKEDILKQYGIDISKDFSVVANEKEYRIFLILQILILLLLLLSIIFILIKYNKKQNKKIAEITNYIKEINNGNYSLDINDNNEDELSILKNELYKITVMLKEQSENSFNDKMQLKKSLEDISHQLKTPLTSITIMLDNLQDNPNMDLNTRNDFLKSISREITNINSFVQVLLKLSKFDVNAIKFDREKVSLWNIVKEAEQKISVICDLKNVEIINKNIDLAKKSKIVCDYKWQVEAITNILKNCVEYSSNNTKIIVSYENNPIYSEINIQDFGVGMDENDVKHIFERFYKGKNSNTESIGIGMALAKTIIEKDNGYILVESKINKGTKFSIRYLKTS